MEEAIARGEFLEHAAVHGNFYGTSLKAVAAVCAAGKVPVLDIDVQGAAKVRHDASCVLLLSCFIWHDGCQDCSGSRACVHMACLSACCIHIARSWLLQAAPPCFFSARPRA